MPPALGRKQCCSIHLIALQLVKKLVVRLFARATKMNGHGIAPPRKVYRQQNGTICTNVPAANAHKYYRRAVFFHLRGPTTYMSDFRVIRLLLIASPFCCQNFVIVHHLLKLKNFLNRTVLFFPSVSRSLL